MWCKFKINYLLNADQLIEVTSYKSQPPLAPPWKGGELKALPLTRGGLGGVLFYKKFA